MTGSGPDARRLAAIHAEAFGGAAWSADAFADLLGQTGVFAAESADGFILMRVVADEAEILTLAVRPSARRGGQGAGLVGDGVIGAAARHRARPRPCRSRRRGSGRARWARTPGWSVRGPG